MAALMMCVPGARKSLDGKVLSFACDFGEGGNPIRLTNVTSRVELSPLSSKAVQAHGRCCFAWAQRRNLIARAKNAKRDAHEVSFQIRAVDPKKTNKKESTDATTDAGGGKKTPPDLPDLIDALSERFLTNRSDSLLRLSAWGISCCCIVPICTLADSLEWAQLWNQPCTCLFSRLHKA
jgi:hypothetical protein